MKYLLVILGLIAGPASASTNFYAHASTTETNVFLGQVFNLDVIVKADTKPNAPDLTGLHDFNATLLDDGQTTSATNTWLYRYAFRARREGGLQIPALRFGSLYTKAVPITAGKPEQTDRMKLDLHLSKSRVYLGQPVLLKTTWDSTYQFGAIKAVDFHFPVLNDKRFQILELHEPGKEGRTQTTGLPVHGTRVLAERKSYKVDEVQHQSLTFSKLLIPKKSGTITIPSSTLLCAAEEEKDTTNTKTRRSAFQYPSYFDNTFFDQNVTGSDWSRIYVESAPVELTVEPLPTEGRPDLFNGMVGDYSIKVEAEPTQVRVGEPITLMVTITASNYMENIFFEPLRYQPLLLNRFEIPTDRSLPARVGKSKIYTQTVRPLSTGNTEIPPIQLAYFSPTSNAYRTVQSKAIPLTVSPAEDIGVFSASAYQSRLQAVEEGIRHNYEAADMLRSRRRPLLGTHPFILLAVLLLPPLAAGAVSLVSVFGEKRHHIHRTAKAARAYRIFRRNVAHIVQSHSMKSEIYCGLDQVLRAYLGDRLHLTPGALSFRDAAAKLAESDIDHQTLTELRSLFELCEAYRFTRGYDETADARPIVRNAVRTVKAVERSLK
jgi:hypothetical protein